MARSTLCRLLLLGALLAGSAGAQQTATPPTSASATPAAASAAAPPPTTDAKPAGPSPELVKKAQSLGLNPETRGSHTVYCWEEATIGSRFKDKHCVAESQLDAMVEKRAALQQQIRQGNCGAGGCVGH